MVEIFLELRNVAQFVTGAKEAEGAMGKVGTTSEKAGKQAGIGWKGVAKWAAGAGIAYGAAKFMKSAVGSTMDLAKATLTLQRSTNMDTQTASEWAALTKERGISTSQFQMSLAKLSKTMETARTGTSKQASTIKSLREQIDQVSAAGGKKAPAQIAKLSASIVKAETAGAKARTTLTSLGVPLQALQKGDTETTLLHVATAMQNMRNHAERLALAQSLFGRSGKALLPILMQGATGIHKLLDEQKASGNYIDGKGINSTKKLIEQQRALDRAYSGLKVQMGMALLPVMLSVGKVLVKLSEWLRPITSRAWALKLVLVSVTVALIALKVAAIASAAASGEMTVATKAWTVAQWLFNAAMEANPLVLVTTLIIALGVAFFVAYKKVGWFHDAVDTAFHAVVSAAQFAWGWLKKNWPLLLGILTGPFGLAAVLIVQHFGKIKQFVLDTIAAIRSAFSDLISWLKSLPSKLAGGAAGVVKKAAKSVPVVGGFLAGKLAAGGTTGMTGTYLVGERGPELVSLPRGANVIPNGVQATTAGAPAGSGALEITVPVMIDAREIARATARVTADKLARR